MRDYDEVTQTVLRRRDEAIAKDRRRAVIMRRSAAAALSVCAAAFVGFGVFRMNSKDIELPDDGGIITAETTVPPASHSVSTFGHNYVHIGEGYGCDDSRIGSSNYNCAENRLYSSTDHWIIHSTCGSCGNTVHPSDDSRCACCGNNSYYYKIQG